MSKNQKPKIKNQKLKVSFPSELRFDVISEDWVIVAKERAKRPEFFKRKKKAKIDIPKEKCPFCNLKEKKILEKKNTFVIKNKFPALLPGEKIETRREGEFYQVINAIGYCEVVVMKDHRKHFPHFKVKEVKEVFDVYQERYLQLMKKPFVKYISIFHNHGREAGASQPHPHSQIITTSLIDVDLKGALLKSKKFFKKEKKCIYCQMNRWERKVKKRIVFENRNFIVLCPFASKSAFQTIISPKFHSPYFEKITEKQKWDLSEAFQVTMKKLYKALNDPPYNFYLHTAPVDGKKYPFYHWHWTILPKISIPAGFELGTRMEICVVEPEKATTYLKQQ
jgi:UDPglucose--hexose-1-phosphate uridylyltransferase